MTTTNDISIGGFKFKWAKFENLHGLCESRNDLSRFNRVAGRLGVYIFIDANEACVLYVGMCGKKIKQDQDLKERIGQYFEEGKSTGINFPDRWMEKECRSYEDFRRFIATCKLGTFSTEKTDDSEILVGDRGIIGEIEHFLIYKLNLPYNDPVYRLKDDEDQNIYTYVNARIRQ